VRLGSWRSRDRSGAQPRAQGFASRWCAKALFRRRPTSPDWLFATLKRDHYDATLFFEEATADLLSLHRARVQALTGCPLPPREIFLAADRKDRAARLARQLGVAVPETYELESLDDAARLARTVEFPVIVKGVHSSGSQQVVLVAIRCAGRNRAPGRGTAQDASLPLPIVQQYVPGRGTGWTALMRRGDAVATFMHRRMAEHDIAAGVALAHGATARSASTSRTCHGGNHVAASAGWDGIAMVEFRKDATAAL
jgi:predicted ATP-grasp superfamily ATP-dependent carboligase